MNHQSARPLDLNELPAHFVKSMNRANDKLPRFDLPLEDS
jgi:hypothetical protein